MSTPEYIPELEEVANLIVARTKDKYGNEVGNFTADTRPTGTNAQEILDQAIQDVIMVTDTDIPAAALGYVRRAITLRAAMIIERSYYPEQINNNRSPYIYLRDEYIWLMGDGDEPGMIQKALEREAEEEISGELPPTGGYPSWAFPEGFPALEYRDPTYVRSARMASAQAPTNGGGSSTEEAAQDAAIAALQADVATLETDVDGKADTIHTHAESEVVNLVSDLAGKAPTVHGHAEADIVGLVADLASKAPTLHGHGQADIVGLVADLAGKQTADADLTLLAALSTTAFGRSLLELASAAATRTALGVESVASSAARYRSLFRTISRAQASNVTAAAVYMVQPGGGIILQTASGAAIVFILSASELAIAGLTTKLRFVVAAMTNAVAPGQTLTFGLYPVGIPSGGTNINNPNFGAVVAGSQAVLPSASMTAASKTADITSGDFDLPADGWYGIGVESTGALAANAAVAIAWRLEVHNV